ncbi:hypothetical protein DQ04_01961000 [Trypanosoma grayi]|uniref:hypothetical protein n=1 Tax=Trypanosoma grayi TaxID=71804 RepID=UPI0004F42EEB|nr:hypothetical protein DQ04_01961000 [Trypanosoma grayi]KEG12139.1 hypothetical protein DQ04_01961000 [Trypanosoma grayi]
MSNHGYYGGYSLVRSSTNATGGSSAGSDKAAAAAAVGLARVNFASCNSDWMPSLARSSAAGARSTAAPVDAGVQPAAAATESATRNTLLRAFLGVQNFYRGVPLRAVNNNTKVGATPSGTTTTSTASSATAAPAAISAEKRNKKKILSIPTPIGSDTWAALSDAALTAKSGVVATRHGVSRPVAPMAIGVSEMDLEEDLRPQRRAPEPLFRDLLALSSPLETNTYTDCSYNLSSTHRSEPVPVGGLQLVHERHHPVPPTPISVSPLLVPQNGDSAEQVDAFARTREPDSPEMPLEEGYFVSQALLDEVNAGSIIRSASPISPQEESATIPLLFGGSGGGRRSALSGSLLREGDEEIRLFDGDEEEDALERIKRAINIVMSVAATETPAPDADAAMPKPKKGVDFDMEWVNAKHHGQQQCPFFHGI